VVVLTPPFLPASMQAARAFRLLRLVRLAWSARRLGAFFTLAGLRYATVVAAFGILAGAAASTGKRAGRADRSQRKPARKG
jgi:hypothetical protein